MTRENNGQTITLATDDMLDVALPGNPGTGFTWELDTEDLGALQQVAEPWYVSDAAVPGAPGTYTFHFAVIEPGMSDLSFAYRRPWERDAEPAQTFNISINVPPSE
ncbi:MAG: protease inhibitor I42 family protein [Bacteroidetes bacterium]|nr:protease inhibitor I42 family protein [Bacteroidota bacterium]